MEPSTHILGQLTVNYYVVFCSLLFAIGMIGVLTKRNALVMFMSIELMLNSVNVLFAAFSVLHDNAEGQVMVIFAMLVAAAEVAIGLAILVLTYRINKSIDMGVLNKLKW